MVKEKVNEKVAMLFHGFRVVQFLVLCLSGVYAESVNEVLVVPNRIEAIIT